MLIAAGLPTSRQIIIHGFITSGGMKISKSLGNSVDPIEYTSKYGVDALRYYLLAKIDPFEDSDFTRDKFDDAYRADLQNGLGNLVSRVAAMCEKSDGEFSVEKCVMSEKVKKLIEAYKFDEALREVFSRVKIADQLISEKRVWELKGSEKKEILEELVKSIRQIAIDLRPFLPETAIQIAASYENPRIKRMTPLFPRIT